jgi:hypothetical protein
VRPLGIINLDLDELCAAAGGDPWAIDDQLQRGDAGAINDLATALHRARGNADGVDEDFDEAKRKFEKAYQRDKTEHPINDSAEVARASAALTGHRQDLNRVAVKLEEVAAALAVAQRASGGVIAGPLALNFQVDDIDNQMFPAKAAGQDLSPFHDAAVEAIRSAPGQVTAIHGTYVEAVRKARTEMALAGYQPEVLDGVDAMPTGTPNQRASLANEKRLREARARTQTEVDRLQHQLGQMLATDHGWNKDALDKLAAQIRAGQGRLAEFDAVDEALRRAPETYLTQLEIPPGDTGKVHAAVAVGNPDTAANVSVTVPGLGGSTRTSLPDMVSEARSLREETTRQLVNEPRPASVATIAWMGYDPPPNPINTHSPRDGLATLSADQAKAGASSLSSYLEQVRANSPDAHITLLGHSYGSLTSSLALQDLNAAGAHPVNDVVFYGSPGLGLTDPAQLGLGAGHAYVMGAPTDPIVRDVAPWAPAHGWGGNPYDGLLPQLSAQAGPDPAGVYHPGVAGHADYPRLFHAPDGRDVVRMSEFNLAAITAGLPGVPASPQVPLRPPNLLPPNVPPEFLGGGY